MALYAYKAIDPDGKTVQAVLEAPNKDELVSTLRQQGMVVLDIERTRKQRMHALTKQSKTGGRVKADDIVVFSRQLATMVSAGLPLIQSLDVLREQMENPTLRSIIRQVEADVEGGLSLSEALAKHPKVFSPLFINMVRAGEASGMLDEILNRIAGYLEKAAALRRKVRSALVYPILISIIAVTITSFLILVVIPKFKEIFEGLGSNLPAPTQMLITFSEAARRYFPFILLAMVGAIVGIKLYGKTDKGRYQLDLLKMKVPIFGILVKKVAIAKFARTLATLIRSGVSILTALEIVSKTAGNKVIENAVLRVRASIREGESIAEPLSQSGVFPPMVVRMIAVGEQTGALEDMLAKIADFYDDEVNAAVAGLTSMIEPLIIAFLGIVIGSIVIAMFLPIFKISSIVSG